MFYSEQNSENQSWFYKPHLHIFEGERTFLGRHPLPPPPRSPWLTDTWMRELASLHTVLLNTEHAWAWEGSNSPVRLLLSNVSRGQGEGRGKAEVPPPPPNLVFVAITYLSVTMLALQVSHGARWVGGECQDGYMELP